MEGKGKTRYLVALLLAIAAAALAPASASAATDGKCSLYADNHLLGSNHRYLSWQADSFCGWGVNYMKLTYTVTRDGNTWYGGSLTRSSSGALQARDTPRCTSGTHTYQLVVRLNYRYLNDPRSLGPVYSIKIRCTG